MGGGRCGAGPLRRRGQDGPVSRLLNRRLSSRISLVLLRAGVSPGAATVGAFLFALAAAVVLALGAVSTAALVTGGILVQLVSILDGVDGEIARASLRSSPTTNGYGCSAGLLGSSWPHGTYLATVSGPSCTIGSRLYTPAISNRRTRFCLRLML